MSAPEPAPLDLDAVLPRIFSLWWRNLPVLAGLTGVCLLPLLVLTPLLQPGLEPDLDDVGGLLGRGLLSSIAQLLFTALAVATVTHAVLADRRGETPAFSTALSDGVKAALSALGVLFVQSIGVSIGCFLCCLPGLALLTFWFVAVPVAVVERPGLVESFATSQRLVLPSFFPVLVVLSIVWIGIQTIGVGAATAAVAFFGGPLAGAFVGWILGVFGTALIGVSQAVVYTALREGGEPREAGAGATGS